MPDSNTIALAAVVTTGAVALVSSGVQTWNSRQDRKTTRAEKKADRLWVAKSAALQDAAELAARIERTMLGRHRVKAEALFYAKESFESFGDAKKAALQMFAPLRVLEAWSELTHAISSGVPDEESMREIRYWQREKERWIDDMDFEKAAAARDKELRQYEEAGLTDDIATKRYLKIIELIETFEAAVRRAANS